jgi:transposase
MKQAEKMEIITLVEQSELSVKATLKELGIHRSTFYEWYKRYLEKGYDGLAWKRAMTAWPTDQSSGGGIGISCR